MNARHALDLLMEDPDTVERDGKEYNFRDRPQLAFILTGPDSAVGSLRQGMGHSDFLNKIREVPSEDMAKWAGFVHVGEWRHPNQWQFTRAGRIFPVPNVCAFWSTHARVLECKVAVEGIIRALGKDPTTLDYEFSDSEKEQPHDPYGLMKVEYMTFQQAFQGDDVKQTSPEEEARLDLLAKAHFDAQARAKLDQMDPAAAAARRDAAGSNVNAGRAKKAGYPTTAGYNYARRIGDSLFTN